RAGPDLRRRALHRAPHRAATSGREERARDQCSAPGVAGPPHSPPPIGGGGAAGAVPTLDPWLLRPLLIPSPPPTLPARARPCRGACTSSTPCAVGRCCWASCCTRSCPTPPAMCG